MIRSDHVAPKILLFQALRNFSHISMGTELRVTSQGSKTRPMKAKLYIVLSSQAQLKLPKRRQLLSSYSTPARERTFWSPSKNTYTITF